MRVGILLAALAAVILSSFHLAEAQQPKVDRIGVLLPGKSWSMIIDGLRVGLAELGLEEGKQFVLDIRDSKGDLKVAEEAARYLEKEKVNLLYTTRTSVTVAAKRSTTNIPIVFSAGTDPVVLGLVDSFAHPGGRLTGVYDPSTDLVAKRLQILKEIVPKLHRVLAFYDPSNPVASESARLLRAEIHRLGGIELVERLFGSVEELQASVRAIKPGEADAFFQLSDSMVISQSQLIIDTARVNRLPTMFIDAKTVVKGGLATYAVDYQEVGRRAAKFVERVLSGFKPKDLPVEGVDKIDLVINLKTAKQIGLTIPPNVLVRAARVIR